MNLSKLDIDDIEQSKNDLIARIKEKNKRSPLSADILQSHEA